MQNPVEACSSAPLSIALKLMGDMEGEKRM